MNGEFNSGCIVQRNMVIRLINRNYLNECYQLNELAKEYQCNDECTMENGCVLLQQAREQFKKEIYENCVNGFLDFGLNI